MQKTRWMVVSALATACAALYACGSSDNSLFDNGLGDGGAESGDTSEAGGLGNGDGGPQCTPACAATDICSVVGRCIPKGTCAANGDCTTGGTVCDDGDGGTFTCVPGGNCGATKVAAQIVPPNLLITLDRSCSMTDKVKLADGGSATKWAVAVGALDTLTTNYAARSASGSSCSPTRRTRNAVKRTSRSWSDRCTRPASRAR